MRARIIQAALLASTAILTSCEYASKQMYPSYPPQPASLHAYGGSERVDLYWEEPQGWHNQPDWMFEVFAQPEGAEAFNKVHDGYLTTPAYSDFSHQPGTPVAYKVRTVRINASNEVTDISRWSETASATPLPLNPESLLSEVQEASFRYFWNYKHPVSGLPREGAGSWTPNMCSIAASGMMFFNIAVGIKNEWISYDEGLAHIDKALTFLTEKAQTFYGVYPHWIHGETGETIPFSEKDDGADLVETAFLISGALFFREFIGDDPSPTAQSIREKANAMWEAVEWDWFVKEKADGSKPLLWHWSPNHGFAIDLEVVGFTECHITYILALASPTHPITPDSYFNGWKSGGYGFDRLQYDIHLELGRERYGPPLFFTHYSYLGVDPRVFTYGSQNYFEHFEDFCRVQVAWAKEHREELSGTGIWGMTASLEPDGYGVHHPGHDNGTITPTAFLASMPYAPEAAKTALENMYKKYSRPFWGPFGFYDAMNVPRDWFADKYIAIDVGPIAPMIENYKNRFCWDILTQAPEIQRALAIINQGPVSQP